MEQRIDFRLTSTDRAGHDGVGYFEFPFTAGPKVTLEDLTAFVYEDPLGKISSTAALQSFLFVRGGSLASSSLLVQSNKAPAGAGEPLSPVQIDLHVGLGPARNDSERQIFDQLDDPFLREHAHGGRRLVGFCRELASGIVVGYERGELIPDTSRHPSEGDMTWYLTCAWDKSYGQPWGYPNEMEIHARVCAECEKKLTNLNEGYRGMQWTT
jgi:hypothetical protein